MASVKALLRVQVRTEPVAFVDADVDVSLRQLLVVGRTLRQHRLQHTNTCSPFDLQTPAAARFTCGRDLYLGPSDLVFFARLAAGKGYIRTNFGVDS